VREDEGEFLAGGVLVGALEGFDERVAQGPTEAPNLQPLVAADALSFEILA